MTEPARRPQNVGFESRLAGGKGAAVRTAGGRLLQARRAGGADAQGKRVRQGCSRNFVEAAVFEQRGQVREEGPGHGGWLRGLQGLGFSRVWCESREGGRGWSRTAGLLGGTAEVGAGRAQGRSWREADKLFLFSSSRAHTLSVCDKPG